MSKKQKNLLMIGGLLVVGYFLLKPADNGQSNNQGQRRRR